MLAILTMLAYVSNFYMYCQFMYMYFQLKNLANQDETSKGAKKKDRKFLEDLAKDKRYLEEIIDQLSDSKVGNNARSFITKSMVSEVIIE